MLSFAEFNQLVRIDDDGQHLFDKGIVGQSEVSVFSPEVVVLQEIANVIPRRLFVPGGRHHSEHSRQEE